jgi:peptidoglycan/LPS O-acetylase OafA/YrhL
MNPLNPLFAVIVMAIAWITGYVLNLKYKTQHQIHKFETIDGLRGFLAFSVFIHHSAVWFQFKEEGTWRLPDSNLYIHFGETSVALFFMITSFLFVNKIINTKEHDFNWKTFFISRFFRLVPMYYFSLMLIIICILQISNWQVHSSTFSFSKSLLNWLTFTIIDRPDINNFIFTDKVNAGVTWSLTYEWLFYFSLLILSLLTSLKKPKPIFLGFSIAFIMFYIFHNIIQAYHIYAFAGGAIAPFLLKYNLINTKAKNNIASIIVIICFLIIREYSSAKNESCVTLTTIAFTLIAMGASLFGLLKTSTLKFLGSISYSTYLLHGIVLFVIFNFVISLKSLETYSAEQYCYIIFLITPILTLLSLTSYKFIEKPGINLSKKIIQKLVVKKQ